MLEIPRTLFELFMVAMKEGIWLLLVVVASICGGGICIKLRVFFWPALVVSFYMAGLGVSSALCHSCPAVLSLAGRP
jgi:hypothetical protein